MALTGTGNDWGDQIADALTAGSQLSDSEKTMVKNTWRTICSVGVSHLVSNIELSPATVAQLGIPVATTGTAVAQTGATTAPGPVTGGIT